MTSPSTIGDLTGVALVEFAIGAPGFAQLLIDADAGNEDSAFQTFLDDQSRE